MDAGETRQGMGRQGDGDFFVTVDPRNWKRLKEEEEEVTNQNCIHEDIKRGQIFGNVCYYADQNFCLSISYLKSKDNNNTILFFYLLICMDMKFGLSH
jgi:hypothetical protein